MLALFDLPAAFNTVDYVIINTQVPISRRVSMAPCFIGSNHISAVQDNRYVKVSRLQSVFCGIPQRSVLGPIFFIMYALYLMTIIERHGLLPHLFTDDTQVYGRCSLSGMDDLADRVSPCTDEILCCMRPHSLQLNADKTKLI